MQAGGLAAEGLRLLSEDAWTPVDALFAEMQAMGMDPQYGSLGYEGYRGWSLLQGRFVLVLLFEYAATLGVVDVRYVPAEGARSDHTNQWGGEWLNRLSRYDGLPEVRLTSLGRHCLA